jgi:uncharacterized protein (TIGR02391 family)
MARSKKTSNTNDFTEVKQFSSAEEIDAAIQKLCKRTDDVRSLQSNQVSYDDQRVRTAEQNIRTSILEIFGPNSPEYGQIREETWWGIYVPQIAVIFDDSDDFRRQRAKAENQERFQQEISQTITMLEGIIRRIEEKREELGGSLAARTRSTFEGLDLHPRIAAVCVDLYRDRHYRQAVLDASIALVNYVKEKSRRHDLDGVPLMSTVFSANSPVLAFNALADQTDKDEQQGMMHLFMGAVLALRNPRAHSVFDDSPELALDAIAFLSMLAKRLDDTKRI